MAYRNNYGSGKGGYGYYKYEVTFPVSVVYQLRMENGSISPDLFDSTASSIAKSFVGSDHRGGITSSQMRKIFDEVKRFETLLVSKDSWEKQLPYIKMIKSKVAYSVARISQSNTSGGYVNFKSFIDSGIDQIKSKEDFDIFVSLFEAVYGFYYESAPDKSTVR